MSFVDKIRGFSISIYPYTTRQKATIPNDIGLQLNFPEFIHSPENKIIYTLWREGDQSFCNLAILTGLTGGKFKNALKALRQKGKVVGNIKAIYSSPKNPKTISNLENQTVSFSLRQK